MCEKEPIRLLRLVLLERCLALLVDAPTAELDYVVAYLVAGQRVRQAGEEENSV